jgi:hypothetical protein
MTRHLDAERLSAWISGELPDRDASVVRVHIEACPMCAATEAALRAQVLATRDLDRPEPPPTLWPAIEGALESNARGPWAWRSSFLGALAGAFAVVAVVWGLALSRGGPRLDLAHGLGGVGVGPASHDDGLDGASAVTMGATEPVVDPLVAEAEQELSRAAASYEQAARRLRAILDREQARWDPEARARVAERLAGLDEAVAHSRAVARRAPSDSTGADLLFSAYQRQIAFLAEAVHRGSPGGEGLR